MRKPNLDAETVAICVVFLLPLVVAILDALCK